VPLAIAATLVAASLARPASADLTAADKETVLARYDEAKALLEEGKVAEACRAFEAGKRVDPTAMNLLLRLGDCYERLGRTASAWRELAEAAAIAKAAGDPRAAEAEARAAKLEPALPRLVIHVPEASRAPGLEVRLDGAPLPEARWATRVAVDLGRHRIEARAPGRAPQVLAIEVAAGASEAVTIGPLGGGEPAPRPLDEPPPSFGAQRTVAVIAVGAALAGAGLGAAFGLRAVSKRDASNDGHCDAESYCDAEGLRLRDDAQVAGTMSTIAFAASAGALAAGALLWLTSPEPAAGGAARRVTPSVAALPSGGFVGLRGAY
jgi:tetratricopeptide (TPR) repeat protein